LSDLNHCFKKILLFILVKIPRRIKNNLNLSNRRFLLAVQIPPYIHLLKETIASFDVADDNDDEDADDKGDNDFSGHYFTKIIYKNHTVIYLS